MNGFDFDGLVIYGRHPDNPALDLVEMNLTYRDVKEMSRYVVLADDGVVQSAGCCAARWCKSC